MPKRYSNKNYRPKRFYRKKTTRKTVSVRRPIRKNYGRSTFKLGSALSRNVFPNQMRVVLKMQDDFTITSTTGAFTALTGQWNLNDISDPTGSNGTRQPRYYDSLWGADDSTAPYREYIVTGVKIYVEGSTNDAKAGRLAMASWGGDATVADSINEFSERAYHTTKMIGADSAKFKLSKYYPLHKVVAQTYRDFVADDSVFSGSASAAPTSNIAWKLWYQASASQTATVFGTIKATFYVRARHLNDVADSSA